MAHAVQTDDLIETPSAIRSGDGEKDESATANLVSLPRQERSADCSAPDYAPPTLKVHPARAAVTRGLIISRCLGKLSIPHDWIANYVQSCSRMWLGRELKITVHLLRDHSLAGTYPVIKATNRFSFNVYTILDNLKSRLCIASKGTHQWFSYLNGMGNCEPLLITVC